MNDKFYNLPEEKQLLIINAAYKVFAKNSYKKAPASEGMLLQWYRERNADVKLFEQEYLRMIQHWEIIYKETE